MPKLTQSFDELQSMMDDLETKAGASAYLSSPSTVTTTVAGDWYPVAGTFANDFENFEFDTDRIKYIGDEDYQFEIDWHSSMASNTPTTTFHNAVKVNSTVLFAQKMGGLLKQNEYGPCSGTTIVTLTKNDGIQLVTQSDKAGAILSFEHFNATINKFYETRV
jgi:hypothetical protein